MLDRFIQQAVLQVLQADWDPTFSEASFGFRPGRSAHQAAARAQAYIADGHRWVVDPDLVRFESRVRELTRRTRGATLARIVKDLSRYLVGWRGYFGFCQTPSVLRRLDEWIRRRLRAIAWKQWRRGPRRFAELRRHGIGTDLAAQTAGSPHGPWRLSNSPALTIALPLAFFASLGLASLVADHAV